MSIRGRKRKRRAGEVVCRCGAYKFPHRFMGGNCDGASVVAETFESQMWGSCRDCHFWEMRDGLVECQVLEGRDEVRECPAVAERVQHEGTRLYGVNAPPQKRDLRFRR